MRFEDLTDEQKKFATSDFNKPCFSIAVAGAGKTTSCVARIQCMIESGINPENILLISFTNVAANAIIDSVKKNINDDRVNDITYGTFHSVFNSILRRYAQMVSLPNNYTIKTDTVIVDAVKLSMDRVDFPRGRGCPLASDILQLIHKIKIYEISLEDAVGIFCPEYVDFIETFEKVIEDYKDYCFKNGILDFDDILLYTRKLLTENKNVIEIINREFRYIIVDEYQDTNRIQAQILYLLMDSPNHPNITIVGDPNQSIYSFINADIRNILSFKEKFPEAYEASLTTNFRSNDKILDTANALMHNSPTFFYDMTGVKSVEYKPVLCPFVNYERQDDAVMKTIDYLVNKKHLSISDIAVIYRNSFSSLGLQLRLEVDNKYDYVVRGGLKLIELGVVQDILQFLEVLEGTDIEISWTRTLSLFQGIGPKKALEIIQNARRGDSIFVSLIDETLYEKNVKIFNSLKIFKQIYEDYLKCSTTTEKVQFVVTSYIDMKNKEITERNGKNMTEEFERLDRNTEIISILPQFAKNYSSIQSYINDLTLENKFDSDEDDEDKLVLTTIHSSKGLEWKVVIFIDVLDNKLPGVSSINVIDDFSAKLKQNEIEEARRLCYVACTRAKDSLYIYYPKIGNSGAPLKLSRFFDNPEILKTLNIVDENLLYRHLTI